jgi:hypothetical protein
MGMGGWYYTSFQWSGLRYLGFFSGSWIVFGPPSLWFYDRSLLSPSDRANPTHTHHVPHSIVEGSLEADRWYEPDTGETESPRAGAKM